MKRQITAATFGVCALMLAASAAIGETWTWNYTPAGGESATAQVTPLKYGKKFAWSLEIDDSPKGTLTIAQPLLANYFYSDAPPGVPGGNLHPFVGSTALMCVRVEGNSAYLSWDDVATLLAAGWGAVNHGYWHTGNHWDPSAFLTPEQFRRELYWSQQMIGLKVYDGDRSAAHIVYPNGDYHYEDHLEEFGIRSGSHSAGIVRTLTPTANLERIARNNLDGLTTSDPLKGLPATPLQNDFILDFTHGMGDVGTDNHQAWQQRLATIQTNWGTGGTDELWSAPTEEIVGYYLAYLQAMASVQNGQVTVSLPDDAPAAALTIRLDNIDPASQMVAPPGGLLYRSGTTAWITTPVLNASQAGPPLPQPEIRLVYSGPYDPDIRFDEPILFAGLRVWVVGGTTDLSVEMLRPDGGSEMLDMDRIKEWVSLGTGYGVWALCPTLPDLDPVMVDGLNISPSSTSGYNAMEVYAAFVRGDYSGDGYVDTVDYVVWADTFGNDGSPGKEDLRADGNGDGVIDTVDYVIWADNFGNGWPPYTGNRRPTVSAGIDQTIYLPTSTAALAGSASDDGEPSGLLTVAWSQVSGPAGVSFANPAAAETTATLPGEGSYILRLTASDGELSAYDDVTVIVEPAPVNQAPDVTATGGSATWPVNTVALTGSVSDDGLPNPPAAVSLTWSKLSGPGAVAFASPNSANTSATFSAPGSYSLQLTAYDSELYGSDDATVVIWDGAGPLLTVITPAAAGAAEGSAYFPMEFAFDDPPVWDGVAGEPVGGHLGNNAPGYASRHGYIDFGPDWANVEIHATWTLYRAWSHGAQSGYAAMWWDDDKDIVNDSGLNETRLKFNSAASVETGASELWIEDASFAPTVTPQARYLILASPADMTGRAKEYAIIGTNN